MYNSFTQVDSNVLGLGCSCVFVLWKGFFVCLLLVLGLGFLCVCVWWFFLREYWFVGNFCSAYLYLKKGWTKNSIPSSQEIEDYSFQTIRGLNSGLCVYPPKAAAGCFSYWRFYLPSGGNECWKTLLFLKKTSRSRNTLLSKFFYLIREHKPVCGGELV